MDNFSQSCQIHLIDKSLRFFLLLIKHAQIPRIILDSFILHHIPLAEYNLFSKALSFSPDFSRRRRGTGFTGFFKQKKPENSVPIGSLQHFGYCFFHFFCIYRLGDMFIHTDRNRFSSIFFKGIRCHGYDWNLCLFFI